MKTKASLPPDYDEVERCREVRRALERSHGGLNGLCHWLEKLQRQRQEQPSRRKETTAARRLV
jgi:hypothetical protein